MTRGWERQRNILDFTLSSLLRRKGKVAALLLVYTVIVALLASTLLFLSALRREAAAVLADSPEVLVQRMVAGRHDLIPVEYADRLRGIRGVGAVEARLWGYWFDPVTRANYTLLVPAGEGPEPGGVRIGEGISRSRGVLPGDILALKAHDGEPIPLLVEEVLPSGSQLVSADLLLVGEEDFRLLFGIPPGRGHRPGPAGAQPARGRHGRRPDRGAPAGHARGAAQRDPAHLRRPSSTGGAGSPPCCSPGRCWPSSSSPGTRPPGSPPRSGGRSGS